MAAPHERRAAELALLASIYPDEVTVDAPTSEFRFKTSTGGFTLRLPDDYPSSSTLPTLLAAHVGSTDISAPLRASIAALPAGEELLDVAVERFTQLADETRADDDTAQPGDNDGTAHDDDDPDDEGEQCTIVVWLHHLLNTSKRKTVLNPAGAGVSGVSKPGYPGVLIFAGPSRGVREHVAALRGLNWAAFQVRLEEAGRAWAFAHGGGVMEVESMADVVGAVVAGEDRDALLHALKMK